MNNTGIFLFDLTQILISTKFEKEIVFESSVLAWIRIEQKCRIRIKLIRIHNPGNNYWNFFCDSSLVTSSDGSILTPTDPCGGIAENPLLLTSGSGGSSGHNAAANSRRDSSGALQSPGKCACRPYQALSVGWSRNYESS
jgi:hypothetical protein